MTSGCKDDQEGGAVSSTSGGDSPGPGAASAADPATPPDEPVAAEAGEDAGAASDAGPVYARDLLLSAWPGRTASQAAPASQREQEPSAAAPMIRLAVRSGRRWEEEVTDDEEEEVCPAPPPPRPARRQPRGADSPTQASSLGRPAIEEFVPGAGSWQQPTTVMLRNLPTKCSREEVAEWLDGNGFEGRHDTLHLPVDRASGNNLGYAFVNFPQAADCIRFSERFHGAKAKDCFPKYSSTKVLQVGLAKVQGGAGAAYQKRPSPWGAYGEAGFACDGCGMQMFGQEAWWDSWDMGACFDQQMGWGGHFYDEAPYMPHSFNEEIAAAEMLHKCNASPEAHQLAAARAKYFAGLKRAEREEKATASGASRAPETKPGAQPSGSAAVAVASGGGEVKAPAVSPPVQCAAGDQPALATGAPDIVAAPRVAPLGLSRPAEEDAVSEEASDGSPAGACSSEQPAPARRWNGGARGGRGGGVPLPWLLLCIALLGIAVRCCVLANRVGQHSQVTVAYGHRGGASRRSSSTLQSQPHPADLGDL